MSFKMFVIFGILGLLISFGHVTEAQCFSVEDSQKLVLQLVEGFAATERAQKLTIVTLEKNLELLQAKMDQIITMVNTGGVAAAVSSELYINLATERAKEKVDKIVQLTLIKSKDPNHQECPLISCPHCLQGQVEHVDIGNDGCPFCTCAAAVSSELYINLATERDKEEVEKIVQITLLKSKDSNIKGPIKAPVPMRAMNAPLRIKAPLPASAPLPAPPSNLRPSTPAPVYYKLPSIPPIAQAIPAPPPPTGQGKPPPPTGEAIPPPSPPPLRSAKPPPPPPPPVDQPPPPPPDTHLAADEPQPSPSSPKVEGVSPCKFPFIYKSIIYKECTTVDDPEGKPWCSTRTDTQNNYIRGHWAHCNARTRIRHRWPGFLHSPEDGLLQTPGAQA